MYRADDRADYKATLNGDPIEPDFSFAVALGGATSSSPQDWKERSTELRGKMSVEAPPDWKPDIPVPGSSTTGELARPFTLRRMSVHSRRAFDASGAFVAASTTLVQDTARGRARFLSPTPSNDRSKHKCTLIRRGPSFTWRPRGHVRPSGTVRRKRRAIPHDRGEEGRRQPYRPLPVPSPDPADFAVLDRMLVTLEFDPDGA